MHFGDVRSHHWYQINTCVVFSFENRNRKFPETEKHCFMKVGQVEYFFVFSFWGS